MNIKIDDLTFDRGDYDPEGDVLYLGRGDTNNSSATLRSRRRDTACATTVRAR